MYIIYIYIRIVESNPSLVHWTVLYSFYRNREMDFLLSYPGVPMDSESKVCVTVDDFPVSVSKDLNKILSMINVYPTFHSWKKVQK